MDNDILISLLDEAENVIRQIKEAEKEAAQLPSGSVVMHRYKNNKYVYPYHHYRINHRQIQEKLKLEGAALEEYRNKIALHRQYKEEIRCGQLFLRRTQTLLSGCYKTVLKNYDFWTNKTFPSQQSENDYYREMRVHISSKGERMRSRAEVILANTLAAYKIPYFYEKTLTIKNAKYYPDFTIINPLSGKTAYIEYCGLDSTEYLDRLQKKLTAYALAGITEGNQLLIIREYNNMLNSQDIAVLLEKNFTTKRFQALRHWLDQAICDKIQ